MGYNSVKLRGVVVSEGVIIGCSDHRFQLEVETDKSGFNILPVSINPSAGEKVPSLGSVIEVWGFLRSRNTKSRALDLYVVAKRIYLSEEVGGVNKVSVHAVVCSPVRFSERTVGDFSSKKSATTIVAINRGDYPSTYVPLVVAGNNALKIKGLAIGTNLNILANFKSRKFNKFVNNAVEEQVTYELFGYTVDVISNK